MTELKILHSPEIYLFETKQVNPFSTNVLKDFIYYLKYTGKKGLINFSFSGNLESAHSNLSIKENYILDAVPTSLIKDKEDNFQMTSDNLENIHLKELIKATDCINRLVKDLSCVEKKLVGIVKALLSESEYVFMDAPDKYIDNELLSTVKAALEYESTHNQRTVLISPYKKEKWLDVATHWVIKDSDNKYIKQRMRLG
ncbi:MAG: hypothetical protein KC478_15250, partial [Bacteriovoracaceae bacterium]|nr:hypothetical protein [Bacteriovoracaceae bacterium]